MALGEGGIKNKKRKKKERRSPFRNVTSPFHCYIIPTKMFYQLPNQ
jgi:hypothetical protein